MSQTLVHYQVVEGVATLQLNDGKANALSYEMIAQLREAITRAESEAKVAVISGTPGKFCAGFDLKVMQQGIVPAADLLMEGGALYVQMLRSSIPLISACTGHAVAGGALLLLASDYSVGVEGPFKVGLNEVHIGLPLPVLALELARHKIDPRHLSEATSLGRLYDPQGALGVGYLQEVCAGDDFAAQVQARAQAITRVHSMAFKETKKRLWGALANHIEETLSADLDAFRALKSGL